MSIRTHGIAAAESRWPAWQRGPWVLAQTMSETPAPSTTDGTADNGTDDEPTCPNGHVFCPVENPGARDDALECFDCFVEVRC